ncbi:branched-chain amino acid ABC transporter permease [Amorphoplanes digitatis]|uniref:Urea transport system permease protein n=1 Tax=Actinoplanes digitatis TaxID=1868 RepID=A0A7W7HUV8_9ACTN|nr:urea ABC transporter permease subunit UrtB [Actinoplanes digitatis]MBB4761217.1 urea transport system permease protein [Actinoplanes digitatis]GID92834.1 branched-chain amino acid ABC transporter permease [Actinoplanes digitatis]
MGALNQLVIGASIGAVLLLASLGLTFTFGQMGVINMAHGEFIMAGAYTAFVLQPFFGSQAVVVALPVAFVVGGVLGLIMERLLIRRFYGRPLDTLLLTFGISLILQQVARDIFGAPNVQVTAPGWLTGGVDLGGVRMPYNRIFILVLAVGCVVLISVYLSRLRHGRRMRAVMQNRQLAAVSGVATERVDQATFFIGSGLAGVAGVALTLIGPVGPTLGSAYIVDAFLVVVAGGLGQLRGAVIAAFALGVLNSYVEFWTANGASFAKVVVFAVIIGFLQFRPQGMFVLRSRALT